MSNSQEGEINQPSVEDQCAAVHKLAKLMRAWVAYEDNDGHVFYAHEIVCAAVEKKVFPSAIDEIIEYVREGPPCFLTLLRSLYSLSPKTETGWQQIGEVLGNFYDPRPYHKKEYTWRLGKEVQPLALVCRKVENDIDHLGNLVMHHEILLEKLKNTGAPHMPEGFRLPQGAPHTFPKRPSAPIIKMLEDAKLKSFTRIYQRTRELCRYEDETAHFYHAFKLVELFFGIIMKRELSFSLREQRRNAYFITKNLDDLTTEYTEALEEILKFAKTNEMVTLVLRQKKFSRSTRDVLDEVWYRMERYPFRLDYEGSDEMLIPSFVGNQMLGPHVYKLMAARMAIANDLHAVMSKNAQWKKCILQSSEGNAPSV